MIREQPGDHSVFPHGNAHRTRKVVFQYGITHPFHALLVAGAGVVGGDITNDRFDQIPPLASHSQKTRGGAKFASLGGAKTATIPVVEVLSLSIGRGRGGGQCWGGRESEGGG